MRFNISSLESVEQWGSIRKISNPFDFFGLLETKFWHPVLGLQEGEEIESFFEELEFYFEILDSNCNSVGFVKILNEVETVSLHGSIFKTPSVGIKAWDFIIKYFFSQSSQAVLISRATADNPKALSFLFNSGFHISFIQEIRKKYVIHLELKYENFGTSILVNMCKGNSLAKILKKPLHNLSIREAGEFIPKELLTPNVKYFTENARLIFDSNLWFYCLFETHTNYHEVTVFFVNESQRAALYPHIKESYNYYIFSELCRSISRQLEYDYLIKISKTSYNLSPFFRNFKYLGKSDSFLVFEKN
jgi:hypothetical protein